jgi:outer membrane protein OmpA-like peptidoglycan-associated protein
VAKRRDRRSWSSDERSLGGDFWASYTDLMAGLLMVFILMVAMADVALSRSHDDLRDLLTEKTQELDAWNQAVRELCKDEELKLLEVQIDCDTGAIQLPNKILFDYNRDSIRPQGAELLRVAIPKILSRVSENERFWDRLEKVEIRGHADPRAQRDDPYGRNLRISQNRAYSVLKFLTSDPGVPAKYRGRLQEKGVAAGASHSRKPAKCEEQSLSAEVCFDAWRRVEIHLDFSDHDFRLELNGIFRKVLAMVGDDA